MVGDRSGLPVAAAAGTLLPVHEPKALLFTGVHGRVIRVSEVVGPDERRDVYLNPDWILRASPEGPGRTRIELLASAPIVAEVEIAEFLAAWSG